MYKERKEKNTLKNKSGHEALNRNHRAYTVRLLHNPWWLHMQKSLEKILNFGSKNQYKPSKERLSYKCHYLTLAPLTYPMQNVVSLNKIWTVFKNDMNKLLNKKVFLSFSLPGVSYTSSNLKKDAIHVCLLNFSQCDFLLVMDCTVLHILESWWKGTARQTARQCNTLYNQKTRSASKGSSDDKVNNSSNFFFTVICVTYHILLD